MNDLKDGKPVGQIISLVTEAGQGGQRMQVGHGSVTEIIEIRRSGHMAALLHYLVRTEEGHTIEINGLYATEIERVP